MMIKAVLTTLASELNQTLTEAIETEVTDKLDQAAKFDEVGTVTFGLETDDGQIVKVFVNEKDSEKFEKLIADCLGGTDSIEDAINKVATEVDIVDVEWPKEEEEDEEEDVIDGSEVLDDKVYSKANLKKDDDAKEASKSKQQDVQEAMMESHHRDSNISSRFSTSNQHLVFQAILDLGMPEEAMNRSIYRSNIIKGIRDTALLMQTSPGLKTALKMFVKKRVDIETKAEEKHTVKESVLYEGVHSQLYWKVLDQLLILIDASSDKRTSKDFLAYPKVVMLHAKSTTSLQSKVSPQMMTVLNTLDDMLSTISSKQADIKESLNGSDVATGIKALYQFAEPKTALKTVDAIFSSTQGHLMVSMIQRKAAMLPAAIKMKLEKLLELINATSINEGADAQAFGDYTFAEDEAEKILKALENKVTITVVATDKTKLILSPRSTGSFLKVVGSTDRSLVTTEQIEQAKAAFV